VGVTCGKKCQLAWPIDDTVDEFPLRSNQRAELIAANLGLVMLAENDRVNSVEPSDGSEDEFQDETKTWIIVSDSEYVVKGMTEWLPVWRVRSAVLY
jgi:ribonuclease HI